MGVVGDRVGALRAAERPEDARNRVLGGALLLAVAVVVVLAGAWLWPAAISADSFGRDVARSAAGGAVIAFGVAGVGWAAARRLLQGVAMGRPPVPVVVSGHRRFAIRRQPGGSGHDGARHHLRIDVPGHRPLGVRVDEDLARRFRSATEADLWRLGPVVSLRLGDEILHLRRPAGPFPRETEAL